MEDGTLNIGSGSENLNERDTPGPLVCLTVACAS
jgi:hypothetical protein